MDKCDIRNSGEHQELLKKTMKHWFFYGFLFAIVTYPIFMAIFPEKNVEMSLRAVLGVFIAYELFRNSRGMNIPNEKNCMSALRLTAVEFFFVGIYSVAGVVHVYFIWI